MSRPRLETVSGHGYTLTLTGNRASRPPTYLVVGNLIIADQLLNDRLSLISTPSVNQINFGDIKFSFEKIMNLQNFCDALIFVVVLI